MKKIMITIIKSVLFFLGWAIVTATVPSVPAEHTVPSVPAGHAVPSMPAGHTVQKSSLLGRLFLKL